MNRLQYKILVVQKRYHRSEIIRFVYAEVNEMSTIGLDLNHGVGDRKSRRTGKSLTNMTNDLVENTGRPGAVPQE